MTVAVQGAPCDAPGGFRTARGELSREQARRGVPGWAGADPRGHAPGPRRGGRGGGADDDPSGPDMFPGGAGVFAGGAAPRQGMQRGGRGAAGA